MPTSIEDFFIGLLAVVVLGFIAIIVLSIWWWLLKASIPLIKQIPKAFWWWTDRQR
jgi:hypothetical protein